VIVNTVRNNRSGIVSDMFKSITQMGINVGVSTAAKVGSQFSLIILVSNPGDESPDHRRDEHELLHN